MHPYSSAETVIDNYLQPVFNWTAFTPEQGIPYTNFNDCKYPSILSHRHSS